MVSASFALERALVRKAFHSKLGQDLTQKSYEFAKRKGERQFRRVLDEVRSRASNVATQTSTFSPPGTYYPNYATASRNKYVKESYNERRARIMAKCGNDESSETRKLYALPALNNSISNFTNQCTLISANLVQIPKQTTADEPNLRDNDQVNVAGVSMNWVLRNQLVGNNLIVHVAVVVPKGITSGTVTLSNAGFLKAVGTGRGIDVDINSSSQVLNTRPINTDLFDIVWRKKYWLAANTGDAGNEGKNIHYLKEWIPIKRQFRFGADGTTSGTDPFLVWWCDVPFRDAAAGITGSALETLRETHIHYSDVE